MAEQRIDPVHVRGPRAMTVGKRLLAEFVVIVVGVLVALAVDDFRASRQDRALERHYLDVLSEDLAFDTLELARLVVDLDSLQVAGRRFSAALRDPLIRPLDPRLDSIRMSWDRVPRLHFKLGNLELARATYEELIASGNIRVLRSRELRRALADYHLAVERQRAFEVEWNQTLVDSWQLTLREKGLLIIDLARDSTLVERLRGDEQALAIVRALGAGSPLLRDSRVGLADKAKELLALVESLR